MSELLKDGLVVGADFADQQDVRIVEARSLRLAPISLRMAPRSSTAPGPG